MELLNAENRKRTVLLISDADNDLNDLALLLSPHYRVVHHDNSIRDYGFIKAETGAISVVILTAAEAAADDFALFQWVNTDSQIAAVPMLIYCGSEQERALAVECLRRGSVDIIEPPLWEDVILHRIENAIRLKDSATFYEIESMLRELPSNIFLKDEKGRSVFATHYWHHLEHPDDPDWTIRGKTDLDIRKDKENARKAMEADQEILRTGKGTSYIIEEKSDGVREFLELIKEPVRDAQGNVTGIIALINDVTEMVLLRMSLEEKAMKDELTGADNRHCFEKFTSGIKTSVHLPMAIISADCNDLKEINDTFGHYVGDEYIRMSVMLFRTVLPEGSYVFRVGGDEFILVLPETDIKRAQALVSEMEREAEQLYLKGRTISVSYGVSCMEHSDQDIRACIEEADARMYAYKRRYKLQKKQAAK